MGTRYLPIFVLSASVASSFVSTTQAATSAFMEVTVTVVSSCAVEVSTIDFGHYNGEKLKRSGEIKVSCNNGVPYAIGLDAGQHFDKLSRRMADKDGRKLPYRLSYSGVDWGDKTITDTFKAAPVTGVGNGTAKAYKVEAMIWPNRKASPGVYKDTVTVTVAF